MFDFVLAAALVLNPGQAPLLSAVGFAFGSYALCKALIPVAGPALLRAGLSGRDKLKPASNDPIPECLGAAMGAVYILCLVIFVPFLFMRYLSSSGEYSFPHSRLAEYLSGVMSLQSMLLLGIADDLFDLRWRHKFFLPAIAAIPMLLVYYVNYGATHVALPPFLNLGESIDLGWIYYVYMGAMAIFCTNCINIYAGVNGLEVGQSVVVALGVLANDLFYLLSAPSAAAVGSHLLSAYIVLPFLGGSVALLRFNWFPAQVFVGDTYCYLSGMVFAVVGILGHFSKTMLLLFGPQIVNFVYSLPQLLRIVPCPRHRMPLVDAQGRLLPSRADVRECRPIVKRVLGLLAKLGLIRVWRDPKTNEIVEMSNLTLIVFVLGYAGPIHENQLTTILLVIQAVWTVLALVARHMLARLVFGHDNTPIE